MEVESISFDKTISNSVTQLELWISNNSGIMFQYAINVFSAALIIFLGNIVVKSVANSVAKVLTSKNIDKAVVEFIHGIVRYALFIVVLIAALSRLGVQTASVVAIIGAAGLAVGLALQGSLSNFAAGVLIVVFRPFKSGDYVEVAGVSGCVDAIQIFQTILITIDNKIVIVPNSGVIGSPITNYSRLDTRRVDLVIGVSYKSDLKAVKQVIQDALEKDTRILKDKEISIGVLELGNSSVNFVVRPWCKTEHYWDVYFDTNQTIKEALDAAGIEIPYNQLDVHIKRDNFELQS